MENSTNDLLKEALTTLEESKNIIRQWHRIGMPEQTEKNMWLIYEAKSPEMKRINETIKKLETYLK